MHRPCLSKERIPHFFLIILILTLPYAIFYWMLPSLSDVTIGNDYQVYPIQQQIELQYSLEKGEIPLYVPGFAEGHSASALTLGQLYHPVRVIAAALPGYWKGGALTANTITKLLGIGLVHLFVFYFFINLKVRLDFSFILSFIAVYNLRMLDMFRYGASLENYLAYIMVCVALGFLYLQNSNITGLIGTAVATYLLCVGGHPQIMYLGLLGVGFCFIIMPFVVNAINPKQRHSKQRIIRFYIYGAIGLFAGIALAAVYILPFYSEFVKANTARIGQGYEWSLGYSDTWGGALCSLFRPLNADAHGAFGGTALLVMVALLPAGLLVSCKRFSATIGIIWAITLIIFLLSIGADTPLHRWFWEYFPMADSFRVPGRVTMMMAMPMSLLLAWLLGSTGESIRLLKMPLYVWLGTLSIPTMIVLNSVMMNHIPEPSYYIPGHIHPLPEWVEPLVYTLGIASLMLLILHGISIAIPKLTISRRVLGVILVAVVVVQVGICMRWGTWVEPACKTATWEEMNENKKHSVDFFGDEGLGMELPIVSTQMTKSILDPRLARFYRKVTTVNIMADSYKQVTRRKPDEVVVEFNGELPKGKTTDSLTDTVELIFNTFNTVKFKVHAGASGMMTLSYPFMPGWKAFVDGNETDVLLANGYQIAVPVPSGEHEVVAAYYSKASVAGLIVSLLALGLLILFPVFQKFGKGRVFFGAAVGVVAALIFFFSVWLNATRCGESIETEYLWLSTSQPARTENLAFAKTTACSSIYLGQTPYYHYAGRAVDGEFDGNGWLAHSQDRSPCWQVDLGKSYKVSRIELAGVIGSVATADRPLYIQTSTHGEQFQTVKLLEQRPDIVGGKWSIPLDGVETRFIRLWAPGLGGFGLTEVEVLEQ